MEKKFYKNKFNNAKIIFRTTNKKRIKLTTFMLEDLNSFRESSLCKAFLPVSVPISALLAAITIGFFVFKAL